MSEMRTTFDQAVMKAPTPGGDHEGLSGGYPLEDRVDGQGLIQTPFDDAIVKAGSVGRKETPSSELGTSPTLTNVKDAPAGEFGAASAIGKMAERPNMTIHPPK